MVIGGYDGPIKKLQGTIQSFHQVRTIDNGGHAVESSMHRSIDQYVGKMTSHHKRSEYDDFSFPADW